MLIKNLMSIFKILDIRKKIFLFKTLNKKKEIKKIVDNQKKKVLFHLQNLIYLENKSLLESAEDLMSKGLIISVEQYDEYININYFHKYILKNLDHFRNENNMVSVLM